MVMWALETKLVQPKGYGSPWLLGHHGMSPLHGGVAEVGFSAGVDTNDEEEEEKTKIPPTNDLNISTTTVEEEEEPTKLSSAESPNNGTTIAEEVQTGPAVEELSINAITTEGDSTMQPIRCYQPRHRHSGPQDSIEARMQARQTSATTDEARGHPKDQRGSREATEGRVPEAHPKDNFPLPHIDTLVDNTATNAVFSFMDGFSGYNQIKMAEEDKSKTAFVTHWGTFVYDVMPFGLKNAGATYQRAMVTLFHDMIHHEIEVYVDDMIAKSRTTQDHLTDLRKLFQCLKKYQLRLNPNKYAFGVTSGKLLGFIVSGRGIEIDPAKVQAIRTHRNLRATFQTAEERCEDKVDRRLPESLRQDQGVSAHPPILVPPTPGRPLILYLTVQEASMGCMLGQQDETGKKEQAIYYLSKKRSRGQAIADYLADYPSEQLELMDSEFPDEDVMAVDEGDHCRWKLYFDGAANAIESGIGAVLVSPKGQQTPISVKLGFDCTNNMTEYEACIIGLQAALEFGAHELEVFGDSLLIVSQTNGEWRSLIKLTEGDDVRPLWIETRDIPVYCVCVEECMNVEAEVDNKPWYYDIKRFVQSRERRGSQSPDPRDACRIDRELHANGPFLARKIVRAGYYWLTMESDCIKHVQTCHKCQMYQNCKNAPPQYLHTMASPWPFSAWGIDVIGAITPKASNGHEFILVAIDYFTKWVEACSFKNVTQVAITQFVKNNIICRYGMPEMLITDNASNLNNRMMDQLCQQFKIQHHNSAPYRPKMNGAVEAANKNVKKILSKMMETYKDWHEHLPYALCAYRTSLDEAEWAQAHYEQLNFIDKKRLAALCHGQLYQRRIERAYNKKARPRTFQPRDLILKKRNTALSDTWGKFAPSYESPYVVKKAFSGGAIILADMDGEEFRSPINSDSVIKYHV
uniref:Integrase catalytic domain-containing protein n=1 Tax=Fagus sylvatica TaxID=28930 RepID=A0A2N9HMA4_FAGSY